MATIKNFEDLDIWKDARQLHVIVFKLIANSDLKNDYVLKDQIRRSSGSVMDNIAEGFERGNNKEFVLFLSYAKGSCGELRSQLYRCFDSFYLNEQDFNNILDQTISLSKRINGFISYLKKSEFKGNRFIEEPKVEFQIESLLTLDKNSSYLDSKNYKTVSNSNLEQ